MPLQSWKLNLGHRKRDRGCMYYTKLGGLCVFHLSPTKSSAKRRKCQLCPKFFTLAQKSPNKIRKCQLYPQTSLSLLSLLINSSVHTSIKRGPLRPITLSPVHHRHGDFRNRRTHRPASRPEPWTGAAFLPHNLCCGSACKCLPATH